MGRFATANAQGGSTLKIDGPIPQEGLVSIPDAGTVALEWWHTVPTFSMKQCQIVVLYWQIGLNRKILTQEERIFWWVEEEKHVYLLRSCKLWLCLNRGHNIQNPLVSQEFPYWNCRFGVILNLHFQTHPLTNCCDSKCTGPTLYREFGSGRCGLKEKRQKWNGQEVGKGQESIPIGIQRMRKINEHHEAMIYRWAIFHSYL